MTVASQGAQAGVLLGLIQHEVQARVNTQIDFMTSKLDRLRVRLTNCTITAVNLEGASRNCDGEGEGSCGDHVERQQGQRVKRRV